MHISESNVCSNLRWQRGQNRPLQLGISYLQGAFFIVYANVQMLVDKIKTSSEFKFRKKEFGNYAINEFKNKDENN